MVSVTSPSARRRRWLFALPALAILFALSCVVLAWIGYTVRNARIQERAIKDIRDIGGRVYYPYEGEGFEGTTAQLLACAVLGSEYHDGDSLKVHGSFSANFF